MTNAHVARFALPHQTIELSSDDPELLRWVRLRVPSGSFTVCCSRRFHVSNAGEHWALAEDGATTGPARSRRAIAIRLLERLNQLACFTNPRLAVHSGLVADASGRGIWIPASSGAGKTSLTAQLTMSGLRYSTDEVVAVRDDGRLEGWAKWLSVKEGSQDALRSLTPGHGDPIRHDGAWMVPPTAVGTVTAEPITPIVLTFPDYRPGASTRVEAISRAEALAQLAPEVFNLRLHGSDGVDTLADIVRRTPACVRISYGDGWDAARTLSALLASASADAP